MRRTQPKRRGVLEQPDTPSSKGPELRTQVVLQHCDMGNGARQQGQDARCRRFGVSGPDI